MKILHILETSVPDLAGYTIRAKYIVVNQLKSGLEPVVVTSPFFKGGEADVREENINGIKYYRTNFIKRPFGGGRLSRYMSRYRMVGEYKAALLAIARAEAPDILHAHSSYTNGHAANYVSARTGIPSIYEMRTLWGESAVVEDGLRPGSLKYRMLWRLELDAARRANGVITISEGIKEAIAARGIDRGKISILPNGVDTSLFPPVDKDRGLAAKHRLDGAFVIGYIGSIRKLEGLKYLVEAFREIHRERPTARLLVVGDGPERDAVERLARRLLAPGSYTFTGTVPHKDILSYYSLIDVFVFPRIDARINRTVTPLKPLEAMSAGKVCVGSNVGGLEELIRDGFNGLIFRAEDSDDLAAKITGLIEDRDLYSRLRSNGMEWVRAEREWSVLIPIYMEIYRKILEKGAS